MERTGPIALEVVARKDCTAKGLGMPEGLHSRLKHNCETWLILWLMSPKWSDKDGWMNGWMDGWMGGWMFYSYYCT